MLPGFFDQRGCGDLPTVLERDHRHHSLSEPFIWQPHDQAVEDATVPLDRLLHFFWKEKADTLEPLLFAAGIALLLLLRLPLRPKSFPRARYREGSVGPPTVRA